MNVFKGEGSRVVAIMNVSYDLMYINAKRGKHTSDCIVRKGSVCSSKEFPKSPLYFINFYF